MRLMIYLSLIKTQLTITFIDGRKVVFIYATSDFLRKYVVLLK